MRRARYVALAVLGVVMSGSLLATAGYAWYLRSDRYRNYCAAVLSRHLDLPAEIGQVVPRSRQAREFRDVHVGLPQRRGEAAFCERAILRYRPTHADPQGYELELRGGRSEISTRTWLREDYRFVLESGLRPVFDPAGPRRVVFSGMDLAFQREGFRARLHDASGEVSFVDPHLGQAVVVCRDLNGHVTSEPVALRVQFSPQARGIRLDRVELAVPELPIAIVELGSLAGIALQTGSFGGRLVYREYPARDDPASSATRSSTQNSEQRELKLSGKLSGLQLAECTRGFLAQRWRGSVPELELEELTLIDERVERIRCRGVLMGLVLGDVLAPWNLASVGGQLVLRVQAAELSPAGIDSLVASGRCENVALEQVSAALGWGRLTGRARLVVDDLTITQNRLAALDAELVVGPPNGESNFIERSVVSEILRRTLGITLPSFLPERFAYTQLGVRLEVRDEVLHVFGTHGPRQKAILSVRVGDQEFPVIFEPEQSYDLRAHLDTVRARLLTQLAERLRTVTPAEAWRTLSAPRGRGTAPPKPE